VLIKIMNFQFIPTAEASVTTLMNSIERVIINPLIVFIFALAVVLFLYGVVQYFVNSDKDEVRTTSKSHMLWGLVGMMVMVSVFFIMRLILSTLGVGTSEVNIDNEGKITVQKIELKE